MNFYCQSLCILASTTLIAIATDKLAMAQSIQTDGTTSTQPEYCSGDCTITDGLQQGNNLFHSFERFNVDNGATVLFEDSGVTNILGRVTGDEVSNILGSLGVTGGDANIFLLNPNGIIFGENSSLNINGSFLATTADAVRFGEQGLFDTSDNEIPLLTVNPSALIFAEVNRGDIVNRSIAPAGEFAPDFPVFGLRVPDGESLLLVGGDVLLDGGGLNASEGRVELGGLAEAGEIQLDFFEAEGDNIRLNIPVRFQRADVFLTNKAEVYVTGQNRGDIVINAQNSTITSSSLIGGISGNSEAEKRAGNIVFDITENLKINNSVVGNQAGFTSNGNGGNILINSGSLFIDNSQLTTATFGQGNGGNINLYVRNGAIRISNASLIGADTRAIGDGGNINIKSQQLFLAGGSQLSTAVISTAFQVGRGKGGNISLNVDDLVSISGFGTESLSNGIITASEQSSEGSAGDINLKTNSFRIADGGIVSSQTLSKGNGGDISINANTFEAVDGGQVVASADSSGDAGNIFINSNNILLSGSDPNFTNRLADFAGNIEEFEENIGNETPGNSGFFASSRSEASGSGGNIEVETGELNILDGAEINVSSIGTGAAGSLNIAARNITLDNGTLTAVSRVGDEGNITLTNADILTLRNNSQITTNASELARGGNIELDSSFVILRDSSKITTTAVEGEGGKIDLTAEEIFQEPNSEITAASERNIDGTININTSAELDPTAEFTELPNIPLDAETILAQDLCVSGDGKTAGGSSFIITGRGGTPTRPQDTTTSFFSTGTIQTLSSEATTPDNNDKLPEAPFVEPTGVYRLANGQLILSHQCQ